MKTLALILLVCLIGFGWRGCGSEQAVDYPAVPDTMYEFIDTLGFTIDSRYWVLSAELDSIIKANKYWSGGYGNTICMYDFDIEWFNRDQAVIKRIAKIDSLAPVCAERGHVFDVKSIISQSNVHTPSGWEIVNSSREKIIDYPDYSVMADTTEWSLSYHCKRCGDIVIETKDVIETEVIWRRECEE